MVLNIEQDHLRFRQIVRGKIKQDLKKYISNGELIGKKGKDFVSIPVPADRTAELPLRPTATGRRRPGRRRARHASAPGDVGEDGAGRPATRRARTSSKSISPWKSSRRSWPRNSNFRASNPRAATASRPSATSTRRSPKSVPNPFVTSSAPIAKRCKRQITAGTYDPVNPYIVPIHEDKRYLSWKTKQRPESNALILYMMDVSGSMGDEQKEIVRIDSFWIDTWIQTNYKGVQTRYIIHDAVAQEVDRETFFHTRESGGTVISSAYELCNKIIEEEYPEDLWNIYVFHFSDGDNWSGGDTDRCIDLLKNAILLPKVNLFGYGQVESTYGSGQFIRELESNVADEDKLVTSRIENKEDIYQSIKDFLGKGK